MQTNKPQEENVNKKEIYQLILENYENMNTMMIKEMNMRSEHGGLTGNYREEKWMKFFRGIIPMKFAMAQGVLIIDSEGNVSREVDIAVFDETYSPYLFQYNSLKVIPIEAVAIVIECKSTSYDEGLKDWCDDIANLKSNPTGIARTAPECSFGLTAPTQTRTRPIRILTTLKKKQEQSILNNFENNFDFIIHHDGDNKEANKPQFTVTIPNGTNSLGWWMEELNNYSGDCKENPHKTDLPLKFSKLDDSFVNSLIKKKQTIDPKEDNTTIKEIKGSETEQSRWLKEQFSYFQFEGYEKSKAHYSNDTQFYYSITNTLEQLEIPDNPLLSLNLQLNQLLMLINNPMLFPHFAYAAHFQKIAKLLAEKKKLQEQEEQAKIEKQQKKTNSKSKEGEPSS